MAQGSSVCHSAHSRLCARGGEVRHRGRTSTCVRRVFVSLFAPRCSSFASPYSFGLTHSSPYIPTPMAVPATHVAPLPSTSNTGPPQYPPLPGVSVHPFRHPPEEPYPDIGASGKWSVSSYKFGFGPECLGDLDPDTFWQYVFARGGNQEGVLTSEYSSDGPQPHFVTVEFPRKVPIQASGSFARRSWGYS